MEKIRHRFRAFIKKIWTWLGRYPLAVLAAFALVVFATLILIFRGPKNRFNVGGLVGRLFGREAPEKTANIVPDKRVEGVGEPDGKGWVQQEVKPLDRSRNPFRDKGVVVIPTESGEEKRVALPSGVLDTDIQMVLVTEPSRYEVVVLRAPQPVGEDVVDLLRRP